LVNCDLALFSNSHLWKTISMILKMKIIDLLIHVH
jgi:hypothetical protein